MKIRVTTSCMRPRRVLCSSDARKGRRTKQGKGKGGGKSGGKDKKKGKNKGKRIRSFLNNGGCHARFCMRCGRLGFGGCRAGGCSGSLEVLTNRPRLAGLWSGGFVRHFEALVPSREEDPEISLPACEFYAAQTGKAQQCSRKVLLIADIGSRNHLSSPNQLESGTVSAIKACSDDIRLATAKGQVSPKGELDVICRSSG